LVQHAILRTFEEEALHVRRIAKSEICVKAPDTFTEQGLKPKFRYADFSVTSATSPRQTRDVPFSQNSITPIFPKLPRKGDVKGLLLTSLGSRHSGIWA